MRAFSITLFMAIGAAAHGVTLGQVDNFEDGTVQGWVVNLLGTGGSHPAPPENVATGGPLGADDAFLRLTSVGGSGAGSRMVAINPAQWSGDYATAGVTRLSMNLNNLGDTELDIRILFEKVGDTGPTDVAASSSVHVPAGSGWVSAEFSLDLADMTTLVGDKANALSDATVIRIFHGPTAAFPGPTSVASLGVDNITAVPEPGTVAGLVAGLALLKRRHRAAGKKRS